jgi:polyhydroxyalkanoate synthesis regulator phasin
MSKFWKVVGIAALVAILGVAAIGAVAVAQDSGNGADSPFNFGQRLHDAIAKALGISADEYDAAIDTARQQVLDDAVSEGVLTQDQADQMRERMAEGFGPGMKGGYFGPRGDMFGRGFGHGGFMGGAENSLLSVAADKLGMTVDELVTELQAGKSIADVAGEKGIDVQTITDAYLAQLEESLNQAVTDGKLTQERADSMLDMAKEHITDQLDNAWPDCGPGGFRGGVRPGRFQSFPGQDNA